MENGGGELPLGVVRHLALWLLHRELWWIGMATPLLLFPGRRTWLALPLLALPWLCRWLVEGRLTRPTAADVPIAGLLGMCLLGLSISVDRSASLPGLWRLVLGVAFFYAVANSVQEDTLRYWIGGAVILGSLGLALLTLLGTNWASVRFLPLAQVYGRLPHLLRDIQDSQAFHPRIMGMAVATVLPVPLALWALGENKRYRAWLGLSVLLLGFCLLLTQSIQGAFGIACAVWFLAVVWRRQTWITLPLAMAGLAAGLALYGPQRAAAALLAMQNPLGIAVDLRLDMWSRAVAMIRNLPYTGIGLDSFPAIQSHFYPGVMLGPEPHAHSLFLQVALDLGLPGLLFFLWLVLALGWSAYRAYCRCQDRNRRALLAGSSAGVVSYLASGFLDTVWTSKPSVLLWLLLGLLTAVVLSVERTEQSSAARLLYRQLAPLLLLLLLWPGLFLSRAAIDMNRAAISAHQVLFSPKVPEESRKADMVRVAAALDQVVAVDSGQAQALHLLGRLRGELGEYPAALEALGQRVELDGTSPLSAYAPFEDLRRRFAGEPSPDRWQDTAWIYGHWMSRYPQSAEYHVLMAWVRGRKQGQYAEAKRILESGLSGGSEPKGLLRYFLEEL